MTEIDLDLSDYNIKFIFPKLHISTAAAYSFVMPNKDENSLLNLVSKPIIFWKEEVKNDFEVSAFAKYPQLAKMKEDFYAEGAIYSSMTGSGSVIYAVHNK